MCEPDLRGKHLLLAAGPGLVDVGFVLELLGQVLKPEHNEHVKGWLARYTQQAHNQQS